MKSLQKAIMIIAIGSITVSCNNNNKIEQPQPDNSFKWQVDQFDDIRIMRYQVPDWDSLSLNQKQFVYYLCEAAYWGRDITTDQYYKNNLTIRRTLEGIYTSYEGDKNDAQWLAFEKYLKKIWFANGIHHHYSNDKFTPEFTEEYFRMLIDNSKNSLVAQIGDKETFIDNLCTIIFNPEVAASRNNSSAKDMVAESAVNFYDNVTAKEVNNFYNRMAVPDPEHPISKGLNSKLVKENGKIVEKTYKLDGLYGNYIAKIIENLEKAKQFAENDMQKHEIDLLIDYYRTGDLTIWDEYNIVWSQNTEPTVDYVNGFIEDYDDPLGRKATWESIVNFKDFEETKVTELISANAQWFEDNNPVDPRFKKKEVKGVSAKAINCVALGGATYPSPPIGINLPNADWIRKDYGSKSVTITNLTYAYDQAAQQVGGTLQEFAADTDEIERSKKYGFLTDNLHTDLHECLGHGSGQLLPGVSPTSLLENQSTLEEARADLFALYYLADPKLLELGLVPDMEAYKAEYDAYIRNGLISQLTRIQPGKNIEEAHMRNRALISNWVYEHGLNDNVISKFQKEGKTYVKINDYEKMRQLIGQLLAEVQRIKSEGDYKAGAELVNKYAVKVDPVLHKEILERYEKLHLAPYGGFINPQLTPEYDKDNNVINIKISYPENYIEQMLMMSKNYSLL